MTAEQEPSPQADGDTANESSAIPTRQQITHANHFVPRGLLRRWSLDGKMLHVYDLLVRDERVPEWATRSIRGSAVLPDLYTLTEDGRESDATERWFATEIETPGLEASRKLITGKSTTRSDWEAVIRLYCLQLIRTPQDYFESMARWERDMPELLDRTSREALQQLEDARAEGRALETPTDPSNPFSNLFRIEVHRTEEPGTGGTLATSVTLGRRLWLSGIRHLLEGNAMKTMLGYHWSVLRPAPGFEWPLPDQPGLRLGYMGPERFNFQAGIGQKRADLMMPLSPQHLLHVEVGNHRPGFHLLSVEHTRIIRRALLMRAFRSVFVTSPQAWVLRTRPRKVDLKQFEYECDGWLRWHDEQTRAEAN